MWGSVWGCPQKWGKNSVFTCFYTFLLVQKCAILGVFCKAYISGNPKNRRFLQILRGKMVHKWCTVPRKTDKCSNYCDFLRRIQK
jgi:hypothetical protein